MTDGLITDDMTGFVTRRRRQSFLRAMLIGGDAVALVAAAMAATVLRFGRLTAPASFAGLGPEFTYTELGLIVALLWFGALALEGLYDLDRVFWGSGEYSRVARAIAMGFVGFVVTTFALKLPDLSRGWMLLAALSAFIAVVCWRIALRALVAAWRRRGRLLRRTLIVGHNAEAADIVRQLTRDTSSGLVPVACLASSKAEMLSLSYCDDDLRCLGDAAEIGSVVDAERIDTVVIASTAFDHEVVARIINDLRGRDVDIQLSAGLLDVTASRVLVRQVSGVPLITIKGVSFSRVNRLIKRTFDILAGGAIVLAGLPIWIVVAAAIALDSRGPILFVQERIGRDGRPFGMLKFRSMAQDAEQRLGELAGSNEATGPLFKMKDDPRVTRVGAFLRRYSIDEFPQLINVLRGEMSLVGPRPPLPAEVDQYTAYHWRRMEVLPGMTGLWQVSGRSALTFEEMVRLDLFYIENWSVGFDLGLLMRTIPAVFGSRGAY